MKFFQRETAHIFVNGCNSDQIDEYVDIQYTDKYYHVGQRKTILYHNAIA